MMNLPRKRRGMLEAVGLDFWTKDPTCIWIVNQEEAPKRNKDGKRKEREQGGQKIGSSDLQPIEAQGHRPRSEKHEST